MTAAAPGTASVAPDASPATLAVGIPEDPAVRLAFTARHGGAGGAAGNLSLLLGEGDVPTARAQALALVGAQPAQAVFMQQVHGGDVAEVGPEDAGRGAHEHSGAVPGVDALVTRSRDVALAVLVADCVPVVLVAPGEGVGVVHAGRSGVEHAVAPAAVKRLGGSAPERLVAVIGPAIGGCCYELPEAMARRITARIPQARARTSWGAEAVDLRSAVTAQLEQAGVGRIQQLGGCTRCHHDRWFSHRAATAGLCPPGRQAGMVMRCGTERVSDAPDTAGTRTSLQSP